MSEERVIPLLPEINEKKTIRKAKAKLREYPKWREIACDDATQKVTQEFTFEIRGGAGPNRPVENLAIRRVDALAELEEIEQAVSRLFNPTYRFILYSRFLKNVPDSAYVIYTELGIEKTRYQDLLEKALLAFAWQYRHEALICEKR
nr:MAG TPA: transcriptional regulator [Caudoviricetes sp.]